MKKRIATFIVVIIILLNILAVYAYAPSGYIKVSFGNSVIDIAITSSSKDYKIYAPKNATTFSIEGVSITNRNLKDGDNVYNNLVINGYSFNLNIYLESSSNLPISSLNYTLSGNSQQISVPDFSPNDDDIYINVKESDKSLNFVEQAGVIITNKNINLMGGVLEQTITITKGANTKKYNIHIIYENSKVKLIFSNNIIIDIQLVNSQKEYTVIAPKNAKWFILNNESSLRNVPSTITPIPGYVINVKSENPEYTGPYTITGTQISKIPINTSVASFKTNLASLGNTKVFTANGKEVTSGNIGTGMKVSVLDGNNQNLTAVVTGDINSDGNINALDLQKCYNSVLEVSVLQNEYYTAADINGDGKVNALDLQKIYNHVLEVTSITPR